MILTRRQADAVIAMVDFLEGNLGQGTYHVVLRPTEHPAAITSKRVTIQRTMIGNQPIGNLSLVVTKSLQPTENYASANDFINAYAFVVDSTLVEGLAE
jgi:hypothetical protein